MAVKQYYRNFILVNGNFKRRNCIKNASNYFPDQSMSNYPTQINRLYIIIRDLPDNYANVGQLSNSSVYLCITKS